MFKYILPIILIGIAIAGFFILTDPLYNSISLEREQIASYNEALDNSKALEAQRDQLTQKENLFNPENLSKLQKLLPDNVDNIRLILEIEKVASPYGMVLKDIKYDTLENNTTGAQTATVAQSGADSSSKDYGTWNLEFSTQGTYANFINFIKDLENNLRIVDIFSIQFSSNTSGVGLSPSVPQVYKYNLAIKTYWLKN